MNNERTLAERIAATVGSNVSAFSRISGVGESLLRQYIAGSKPGLDKAAAIAKAGNVSLMWLATGEGEIKETGTAIQPGGLFNSEEAQKKLLNINAAIEANYDKIQKNPSKFNELRADLERIALQESLDDPTRAQADNLLYLIFEDASAGQRREARFSKVAIQMKERIALVQQAVDMAGVEVSPTILELVKTLVLPGEPDASDIARLLKAIAAQSQNI